MNAKHTPGPWLYAGGQIIEDEDGFHVAFVNEYASSFGDRRHEANARLIAAAPDLLEACKKAITCASINSDVRNLVRAAIAKAKGEQP